MNYRKARTQHDEISLWLTCSTYHNPAEKKKHVYQPHRNNIHQLIIKPTRCTNFSNLFLEWNSTCFGQFVCPSSGVFHCTNSNGIRYTGLLTAYEQDKDGTAVPSWSWHVSISFPSYSLMLFSSQTFSRINTPAFLKTSHSSYLPAYEDGTGRVFRNVGI